MVETVWNIAYINELPDKSFAFIEKGGKKDEEGKITPRDLRHLPFRNITAEIDKTHLVNALARLPQTQISTQAREIARKKLCAAVRTFNNENETGKIVSELCGIGGSSEMKKCAETVHNLSLGAAIEMMDWQTERMVRLAIEKVDKQEESLGEHTTAIEELKNTMESHVTFNKKLEEETLKEINDKVTAIEEAIKPKEEPELLKAFEDLLIKLSLKSEDDDDKKNEGKYFNGIEYVPMPKDLSALECALLKSRVIKQLFQEVKTLAKKGERQTIDLSKKPSQETVEGGQQGLTNQTEEGSKKEYTKSFGDLRLRDFV